MIKNIKFLQFSFNKNVENFNFVRQRFTAGLEFSFSKFVYIRTEKYLDFKTVFEKVEKHI